ncbi:MAG TPA: PIN domain-containing protein [Blastocatellia bacterium]|nr:PIN domain-containing protein [Blastocatellia bacterium]HMV87309.1 PIN domain-containing protein [Blastocatellia bacterium]HMX24529.1 PIN domain-containing protein [Blastocatellia bacterium]HMY71620.1 PIN domain-containing protein [Blastocatellia bacterium]HMZ18939.1 PIN domain-containing protein [Blastocatellia bacterium]
MSNPNLPTPLCFVDSNVWLYALIESQDKAKSARARQVIQTDNLCLSNQVINEVCLNLIKKAGMIEADVQQLIDSFYSKYLVVSPGRDVMVKASALRSRHQFSFWDSQIVAAALSVGATVLYTEDMDTALVVESQLKIINPFQP